MSPETKEVCPKCESDLKRLSGESGLNALNWRCKKKCGWNPINQVAKVIWDSRQQEEID